ncbi:2-hydroxyisoflavanone dehydratase [Nymphaea thermarum]|nr:2-hydroxyisoflavanone dehydratase [Nymphaea thermarum]
MDPSQEIAEDRPPFVRTASTRTVAPTADLVPTGVDQKTGVSTKDVVISPETGVAIHLFLPPLPNPPSPNRKKLLIQFHGGSFCGGSTFSRITSPPFLPVQFSPPARPLPLRLPRTLSARPPSSVSLFALPRFTRPRATHRRQPKVSDGVILQPPKSLKGRDENRPIPAGFRWRRPAIAAGDCRPSWRHPPMATHKVGWPAGEKPPPACHSAGERWRAWTSWTSSGDRARVGSDPIHEFQSGPPNRPGRA